MVAINPKDSEDAVLCTLQSTHFGQYEWIPTTENKQETSVIAQARSFNIFHGAIEEVDPRFGVGDLEDLEEDCERLVGYAETEEEARELIKEDFRE